MARILVVDDDNALCMSLGVACSTVGHEVEMATSGRNAIDKGVYFRPEIILTDWMLRDGIDGIAASEAIRSVHPSCHSILLTGYPAGDVRQAALRAKFFGFFEKPFDHEKIFSAIEKASQTDYLEFQGTLGLIEHASDGRVHHVNAHARKILELSDGDDISTLRAIFSYRSVGLIKSESSRWEYLSTEKGKKRCQARPLRTQPGRPDQLLVVALGDEESKSSVGARRLLSRPAKPLSVMVGKSKPHVLLVDDDKLQRGLVSNQLRDAGLLVHSAEDCERALKTLEADDEISIVVLDRTTPGSELGSVIERIRKLSPEVVLVGTSSKYEKDAFEEVGVGQFVLKPVLASSVTQMAQKTTPG